PSAPRVDEVTGIRATLGRYQAAYNHLDAGAAKAVWPSVDERALSRAFSSLESQSIVFDDCQMNVVVTRAVASCRGKATYRGRVGNRHGQVQTREWTFRLHKDGVEWKVDQVVVR